MVDMCVGGHLVSFEGIAIHCTNIYMANVLF